MNADDEALRTWSIVTMGVVACGLALYWLASVLVPFVLAVMVVMATRWGVKMLETAGVPHRLARPVAFLIGLGALAAVGGLVGSTISQLQAKLPTYQASVAHMVADLPQDIGWFDTLFETSGEQALALFQLLTQAVIDAVSYLLIVLVYTVFLLAGASWGTVPGFWGEVEHAVQRYVAGKVFVSAITGALTGLFLMLLGVDLAAAFGVLAFVLNFVPYLGPLVAVIAPIPIALVSDGVGTTGVVLAVALPLGVQFVVGNFVEPRVLGRSLNLHPVTVLLTLALWYAIWGVMGMLLAVPMTSTIKLVLERSERTRPVAELMEGHLTAVVSG